MVIEWKQEYSVDIKQMDDQHKNIMSSLEALRIGIKNFQTEKIINSLFDDVENNIYMHLDLEENYLREFDCKNFTEHKIMHDSFRDMISETRKIYEEEMENFPISSVEVIGSWFATHISTVDKRYTSCFHKNNLF